MQKTPQSQQQLQYPCQTPVNNTPAAANSSDTELPVKPPSKHRLCMDGTTTISKSLSLTQELSKVMRNISIEIVSCHVKINHPSQLLPQTEDDKFIRKHREYRAVRENLKQLVTHIMFKNKTILFEYVDDWLLNNVIVKNIKNSSTSNNNNTSSSSSSTLQKPSIIMPKLRNFFMDLITRTFETNTSLPFDIKNWLMIASVHMIGVIVCESFQNHVKSGSFQKSSKTTKQTKDDQEQLLSTVIKLVSGTVSDFITTRHMHFIESVGSWTQLRHYFVNKNGQLIFQEELEPLESSATSNVSSLYPDSEATNASESGTFDLVLPSLIAGAVATLGVITYAKLK